MRALLTNPCEYCLDGFAPAGIHPDLGPVYQHCAYCLINGTIGICRHCNSESWFPTDYTCPECLVEAMLARGLAPVLCPACAGVLILVPLAEPGDTP